MGYIDFGLMGIIAGMLLANGTDSPTTWTPSEQFGGLLLIAGVVAVLIGVVVQVVSVNRAAQRSPGG
jgi:ABC-type antimicrobial peptide transport system permease subunit